MNLKQSPALLLQIQACRLGRVLFVLALLIFGLVTLLNSTTAEDTEHHHEKHHHDLKFSIQSVKSGDWSDPKTWSLNRIPKAHDRVMITRGTFVRYDVKSSEKIRLLQVVGTLSFARDRNTELHVGILKVLNSDQCSESGFSCTFVSEEESDTDGNSNKTQLPSLLIGTPSQPIPAKYSAKIKLHYFEGMNKKDAPAIACCSARMEIHGSPLSRTWVKLGKNIEKGSRQVVLSEKVSGWKIGDTVLVTASERRGQGFGTFREGAERQKQSQTEKRTIKAIQDGLQITLDSPLDYNHLGEGEFKSEIANLSQNVIIESADPKGVRGHTVYHRFSKGSISYARFAHLGKEGVLGRYSIHFHLVGDTMRGSRVEGAAIVDSHNRWITIHGTQYLVVRDCVGYKSVGHGYFLEDGTEIYNLLDRNLAIHAFTGPRLPNQVLPFDPNDGAGFWWANGLNSFTRNVSTENDEYGYRYDMQKRRNFDTKLPILQPDGSEKLIDVRTIPIWRFEDNEAHSEGFYGMVVAANGNSQPDSAVRSERMLKRIKSIDWTGPDTDHPHVIRNLSIWGSHYAFRPHSPAMRMENIRIHQAAYGIYRPAFENHEYKNLHISAVQAEPFNRGMDDASAQTGKITVDGLTFSTGYGNSSTPLVQISDLNLSGDASTHLRNVKVNRPERYKTRWPLINRGVGPRVPPITKGVPIYIHDHYGPGRHAKVVSTAAKDLMEDGHSYREEKPLTSDHSRVAEVKDVEWPKLLKMVDDIPPATIVTQIQRKSNKLWVRGISHDNGEITKVLVNGQNAKTVSYQSGVLDWELEIETPKDGKITAYGLDKSGNREMTGHVVRSVVRTLGVRPSSKPKAKTLSF